MVVILDRSRFPLRNLIWICWQVCRTRLLLVLRRQCSMYSRQSSFLLTPLRLSSLWMCSRFGMRRLIAVSFAGEKNIFASSLLVCDLGKGQEILCSLVRRRMRVTVFLEAATLVAISCWLSPLELIRRISPIIYP